MTANFTDWETERMQGHNSTGTINDWDFIENSAGDGLIIGRLAQDNGHTRDLNSYPVSYIDRDSGLVLIDRGLYRLGRKAERSKSELRRLRFQLAA